MVRLVRLFGAGAGVFNLSADPVADDGDDDHEEAEEDKDSEDSPHHGLLGIIGQSLSAPTNVRSLTCGLPGEASGPDDAHHKGGQRQAGDDDVCDLFRS